jgi:hypothetical protein
MDQEDRTMTLNTTNRPDARRQLLVILVSAVLIVVISGLVTIAASAGGVPAGPLPAPPPVIG